MEKEIRNILNKLPDEEKRKVTSYIENHEREIEDMRRDLRIFMDAFSEFILHEQSHSRSISRIIESIQQIASKYGRPPT